MKSRIKNPFKSRFNISPSDYIRRELEFLGWKQSQLSAKLGISQAEVDSIMKKEKPMTEKMAEKLELLFGENKAFWLNIDAMYWNRHNEENSK